MAALRDNSNKLNILNNERSTLNGITLRKRNLIKPAKELKADDDSLESKRIKIDVQVRPETSVGRQENQTKEESIIETQNNSEEPGLTYQFLLDNPIKWPSARNMDADKWKEFYKGLIKRRQVIRDHFKKQDKDFCWLIDSHLEISVTRPTFHHIMDYMFESEAIFSPLGLDFLECSTYRLHRFRYRLVNQFAVLRKKLNLSSESLHLAFALFDRYVKMHKANIIPNDLITLILVCLNIATKVEEVEAPALESLFVLTKLASYDKKVCNSIEIAICKSINYQLNIPLSVVYLRMYCLQCNGRTDVYNNSRYCVDLCLQDYVASQYSQSLIAASCTFVGLVVSDNVKTDFDKVWTPKLQCSTGFTYNDLLPLIRNLCLIINKQFYPSDYHNITELYSSDMESYNYPAIAVMNSEGLRCLNDIFRKEELQTKHNN